VYDLHTHTYFSDGVLGLSELARRCQVQGYQGLAICDHCDQANFQDVARRSRRFCEQADGHYGEMQILAGCELTHVPPEQIGEYVQAAREAGAQVVIVHGETMVEPVAPGTNRAAIEAAPDVLAHPGLIAEEDAALAAENGVLLEISGRKGHSFTNGYVVQIARQCGAPLSFGSDGHAPGDYPTPETAHRILQGAGLSEEEIQQVFANAREIFERWQVR
jgi:histidinol phosphatase-like PHP family hydrolase